LIVVNQPWFRQYFDDMTGAVTGDAKGTLYLTYYIRCARGTCLYGDK